MNPFLIAGRLIRNLTCAMFPAILLGTMALFITLVGCSGRQHVQDQSMFTQHELTVKVNSADCEVKDIDPEQKAIDMLN